MSLSCKLEMFGNPSSEFYLSDAELTRMLGENKTADGTLWKFRQSGLPDFIQILNKLFMVSNGGFTIQITPSGTVATTTASMSIDEFIELVQHNRLGVQTRYIVIGSV